jgi:hypothetical protein
MDFDEEDAPPMLVDVEATNNDSLEEPKPVKVPITIVTGKPFCATLEHGIDAKEQDIWELVKPL